MSFIRTNWYVGTANTQDIKQLVNDTGQSGFIKFSDNNYETIAEIAKINYDNDITNLPTIPTTTQIQALINASIFSGNYSDFDGLPALFDGNYGSLEGLPSLLSLSQVSTVIDSCNFLTTFVIPIEYTSSNHVITDVPSPYAPHSRSDGWQRRDTGSGILRS